MRHGDLKSELDRWTVTSPDLSVFQRSVWCRIEEEPGWKDRSSLCESICRFVSRSAVGIPAAVLLIALASGLAVRDGIARRDAIWEQLSRSYEIAIDPAGMVPPYE